MARQLMQSTAVLIALCGTASIASAQVPTYYLHENPSTTSGLFQIKTTSPEDAALIVQSIDLRNQPTGEYVIKEFDTPIGVPGLVGTIPSQSPLTFNLYMRKTAANWGTIQPLARVRMNNGSGTLLCGQTSGGVLGTTLSLFSFTCQTGNIVVTASDRFYLWVGVSVTGAAGNHSVMAELSLEGTGTISYVRIPHPTTPSITGLTPNLGAAGTTVTITGTGFLASQGSSTITFNGVPATVSNWSNTSISTTAPAGVTNGPVVVTVNGVASNGFTFTNLSVGTVAGTVTRQSGGSAVSGALVEALIGGLLRAHALTLANGSYTLPNLPIGTLDLRVTASGLSAETVSAVTVSAAATTTVNVALLDPGSISGTVTASAGGAPVPGATVVALQSGVTRGKATTNGAGLYSIPNLHSGTYVVRASAQTYDVEESGGVVVNAGASTTANLALDAAPVQYGYDELGRLAAVRRSDGEAANYAYDAVGNVLSIARVGSTGISVSEFTPNHGAIGTVVTIVGTGFSATAASNTVTFNGVAATISSASPSQLVAVVPGGAATGQLTVTSPNGSASGASNFVVDSPTPLTITSFSPSVVAVGTALTVNGTGFEPVLTNNTVMLNLTVAPPTSGTTTEITGSVPTEATGGKISVRTRSGTVTSADDLFIAPEPYTPADVAQTGRMTVGTTHAVSISTAGRIALIHFDGVEGQRVSLQVQNSTISVWQVTIFGPHERKIAQVANTGGTFIDHQRLPVTGTYSILVQTGTTSTGTMTLKLNDCPNVNVPIAPGGDPVTVTLSQPGQNAFLSFEAKAGDRVSAKATNSTIAGTIELRKPDDTVLASTSSTFLDAVTLPVDGRYYLVSNPSGTSTGSITLRLYRMLDSIGTITADSAVSVGLSVPGQNGWLYFSGTEGQQVSARVTNSSITSGTFWVMKPDGTPLAQQSFGTSGTFLDPVDLPVNGTYALVVDPYQEYLGSATVTYYDVPADLTETLQVGGAAEPVTLTTPGQKAVCMLTVTQSQSVTVRVTSNTIPSVLVSLKQGTTTLTSLSSGASTFDLSPQTLSPGTYRVTVDPSTYYT